MSLDALEALVDTLPEAKPVPKSPKLRPEEIVDVMTLFITTILFDYIIFHSPLLNEHASNDQ